MQLIGQGVQLIGVEEEGGQSGGEGRVTVYVSIIHLCLSIVTLCVCACVCACLCVCMHVCTCVRIH